LPLEAAAGAAVVPALAVVVTDAAAVPLVLLLGVLAAGVVGLDVVVLELW
jgi:hypothetical protein